jgi:hypothetical protein
MHHAPIPLLCDRCRAEGLAGEDPFARFAGLLDFEPVPRRNPRADGWSADVQRAFIALLACTGSVRQAARAVGRAAFGVEQLLKAPGSEGFRAALEAAHAAAAEKTRLRLRSAVDAAARAEAAWSPAPEPWSHAATRASPEPGRKGPGRPRAAASLPVPAAPEEDAADTRDAIVLDLLESIVRNYMLKLESERRCRLEGRIAEADFYIRQATCLEVCLDVVSGDAMKVLKEYRLGGYGLLVIAQTFVSKLLDEARREHWAAAGDPPRPETPPHVLLDLDGYSVEPLQPPHSEPLPYNDRLRADEEQYARDAREQVKWEAEARRDYERRRDSGACPEPGRRAANAQEPGEAGRRGAP